MKKTMIWAGIVLSLSLSLMGCHLLLGAALYGGPSRGGGEEAPVTSPDTINGDNNSAADRPDTVSSTHTTVRVSQVSASQNRAAKNILWKQH